MLEQPSSEKALRKVSQQQTGNPLMLYNATTAGISLQQHDLQISAGLMLMKAASKLANARCN